MSQTRFTTWHLDLQELLGLAVPPVAIAFVSHVPPGIGRIKRTTPPSRHTHTPLNLTQMVPIALEGQKLDTSM